MSFFKDLSMKCQLQKNKDKSRRNFASLNNVFKSKDHNIFVPYSYADVIVCFYNETEL